MTVCPTEQQLVDHVDGRTGSKLLDHLDECADCRLAVADLVGGDARPVRGAQLGRFVVQHCLGAGGMGIVYEAHDPTLNRRVALKLINSHVTDERSDQRLLREAEAMAQLQHPNVVAVYEVGTFGDQIFIAMELVDGVSLSEWMKQPHSVAEILDVFAQAGRGLVAAHAAGLVHRDFKPDNVLVDKDGRVRVGDFGLARSTPSGLEAPSPDTPDNLVTQAGALMGTPAYMAPEQLTGGTVDARTDQFCFCVALYEALYGRRPFGGESVAALKTEVLESPRLAPPRRGVPAHLRRAIVRGLSVAQSDRFSTLAALLAHLAARPRTLRRISLVTLPVVAILITAAFLGLRAQQRSGEEDMAPDNAEAAAAYADGLAAMRANDLARARDRFARAVELAPDHALSHASLAETWKQLGYDDKAEAEAKLATASATPSSREARLLVQGRVAIAQGQPSEAAKAFAALFAFRPEDVDYGLELAQAEEDDGRPKDADAVVATLQKLPAPAGRDLRIGVMAADVKAALGELDAARTIAVGVAAQARARHDEVLAKLALFEEASALYQLGQMKEALAIADELARDARADLPIQQAMVEGLLGHIYTAQDRPDEAERHYREDLRISRALGSHVAVTSELANLAAIAADRGDLAGQAAVLEESIPIFRERGIQRELEAALTNLTLALIQLGALQKALAPCEESRDIARAMHSRSSEISASLACSRLHIALGEVEEAKRLMDEAVASAREVGDNEIMVAALLSACTLYRTRGEVTEEVKLLDEARGITATVGVFSTYVELHTAELELDDGKLEEAENRVRPIVDAQKAPFESVALADVATAELKRKRYAQAIDAIERAWKGPAVANEILRRIQLLGLAARAYAATGSPKLGSVIAQLDDLAARTKAEGNIEALLEVRLGLAQADRFSDPPKGRRELSALASEAENRGFVSLARAARAALR
jgi:tetratricopeptide (TPR) repeat protein